MFCHPFNSVWDDNMEECSRSSRIDELLYKAEQASKSEVKLLLLGAGNAGKTTFLKQFKIISAVNGEMCEDEITKYIAVARWALCLF